MQNKIRRLINDFKNYIVVITLLLISLFFLSLNESSNLKVIRSYALSNFAILNSLISGTVDGLTNSQELISAQKKNAELMLQVNKLREYGLENDELREMFAFKDSSTSEIFPAKIVSKLSSKVYGYFIINRGLSDSLDVGMPVINGAGFIGLIVDIIENFSTVRSFESTDLKLAVKDQRSQVNGVMNWDGKHLIIKNISTTYDISIGDRIVTSEFSTIIPPSIPVGVVSEKESSVSGLISNIKIQPFVNISKLKNVFVLKYIVNKQINDLELNLLKRK